MGKVLIRETAGTQAVPFLRGILTRSLQGSGLSFEQAYRIASEVRSELSHSGEDREISSQELRKMVGDYLGGAMGGVAAERYMALAIPPSTI
ncbi:MAG: 2-phosphoglycerate kinase, partial [Candidatus Sedimenticola sp. (ex Thyasira tokunagai)]